MTQMRYCVLKTLPVTITMSRVSRQAIAKSMRSRQCNHQVERRPTMDNSSITQVTLQDKGLTTLSDPNVDTYASDVFPRKLNTQRMEAASDSTCTGRLPKYSSGASVPLTLNNNDI